MKIIVLATTAFISFSALSYDINVSFSDLHYSLTLVKNYLPENCKIEIKNLGKQKTSSDIYAYTLYKNHEKETIYFSALRNDIKYFSDEQNFESYSTLDGAFYLKKGSFGKVFMIKINNLICQ